MNDNAPLVARALRARTAGAAINERSRRRRQLGYLPACIRSACVYRTDRLCLFNATIVPVVRIVGGNRNTAAGNLSA